ncbi:cupredoxin domain-containing protein [Paenibacillus senegalensis]|uniref:hypothetical protein n=1 Tax=Paenibacillus senegalensis TaxID=1465766 RepID=UPI000288E2D9|nr:hypothetical protein [Paenibacillus senegalensis]
MKKIAALMWGVAILLVVAACGSNGGSNQGISQEEMDNAENVTIVATNYQFDQTEYRIKKGEVYNIVLDNAEGVHGIEIKGARVKLDNANSSEYFKADKVGEYEIICNIPCGPGHASMVAKLIVEE